MKFSLEFPNAPSGTIESLTLHAMKAIVTLDPSTKSLTFGTGAADEITGGRNIGTARIKALKKTYDVIKKNLKLINKSEFREKLGAKGERIYVTYPRGGMGPGGIKALLAFLDAED